MRRPLRSFTVTGRPEPSRAATATATARSGSSIRAAPAPVLQTFGTGQPMFRSMKSAVVSRATIAAALRMTSGSWPNSWMAIGPPAPASRSAGSMRSISVVVFSLPWWMPKLDTISETTMPAP